MSAEPLKTSPDHPDDRPELKLFTAQTMCDDGQLYLFDPEWERERPVRVSPSMRISEFFWGFVVPLVLRAKGSRMRNIDKHRSTLNHVKLLLGNPEVGEFDANHDLLRGFRGQLERCPGINSGNTVRTHLGNLLMWLKYAGPPTDKYPLAKSLIAKVPYVDRPKLQVWDVEEVFAIEEIGLLIAAAIASFGHIRAQWWRNFLTFYANSGPRISVARSVRFSWLRREHGGVWLATDGEEDKGGHRSRLCINSHAAAAIERQRELLGGRGDGLIFPKLTFVESPQKPYYSVGYLERELGKLLALAKIPAERRFKFHAIRAMAGTNVSEIGSDDMASLFLGHRSGRSVAQKHYLESARRLKRLAAICEQLPQPIY